MTELTNLRSKSSNSNPSSNPDWVPLPWRGQMVTMRQGPTDPDVFARAIDKMIEADINLLVVEVEKGLRYDSHPKVSADWALTKKTLGGLLDQARKGGLECVPLLPSLPHTGYLVEAYPEIAETTSVCPRHPLTWKILDELSDELIELFQPCLFHIGHDEMLSAFPRHQRRSALQCPRCRGDDAAEWFLESILRRHAYLKEQGLVTMMWADMLLNLDEFLETSLWQGNMHAFHGGWPDHFERALAGIPRDVVMCDWHYKPGCQYPSLRYLQDEGFEVLGCPKTMNEDNAFLITRYAQRTRTPNLLGMLGTNWSEMSPANEGRLIQDIEENGAIFGGQDDPVLRQAAEAAESRRFGEGPLEFVVDFTSQHEGLLEAAWVDSFQQNAFGVEGLGVPAGRKAKLCLPLFSMPTLGFESLEVELESDVEFPGPGQTGISVDGGRTFIIQPVKTRTDWSELVQGANRIFWQFEMCNERDRQEGETAKMGHRKCLNKIIFRGRLAKRSGFAETKSKD